MRNHIGPWEPDLAPETLEPLDLLAGRRYTGIVFVGPARSGKTFSLILGAVNYAVRCAYGDMLIVHMSQDKGREFSKKDLARTIRHTAELRAEMSPRAKDDNTFDKRTRSGVSINIGWPSITQLSGSTFQYVVITDYDRPENRDDIDGEGTLWSLAQKRTETYMSRGKTLAESSPGEEITAEHADWAPSTPHEAPPCAGVLSLYNTGTRARRYWPCKHCGEFFESRPGVEAFRLPPFEELEQLVKRHDPAALADKFAFIYCPACGGQHEMTDRAGMKRRGVWLHEGDRLVDGQRDDSARRRSNIASYWLGGAAASHQRWDSMILKYLQGISTYARTGDESYLKSIVFTDFAAPYLSRAQAGRRKSDEFKDRLDDWPKGSVPAEARYLTAAADTQSASFRVNVFAWGVEQESWLVDRFTIAVSRRDDDGRQLALDPASYVEDWEVLIDQVLRKEYPVAGIDFKISPRVVLVDSAGKDGVTTRAYEFQRKLRARGLAERIQLMRGDNRPTAPRCIKTWPDTRSSNKVAVSRGDVPVLAVNVNSLKDAIVGDLARKQPGPGYHHIPKWIDPEYFQQITAEVRGSDGRWENPKRQRNEDFDLHVYNRAACIVLNAEKINWQSPPEWAMPLESRMSAPAPGTDRASKIAALAAGLNGN